MKTNFDFIKIQKMFKRGEAWGLLSSIDVHNCDPASIRDAGVVEDYVKQLCDRINMKRFGECQIVHFGEDEKVAGFSMTQLIETSLISGHFVNLTNHAYIDIFSCSPYDPHRAAEFTREFFNGKDYNLHLVIRN